MGECGRGRITPPYRAHNRQGGPGRPQSPCRENVQQTKGQRVDATALAKLVETFGLPIGLSVALVTCCIALVWYLLRKTDRMGSRLDTLSAEHSAHYAEMLTKTTTALVKVGEGQVDIRAALDRNTAVMRHVAKCNRKCVAADQESETRILPAAGG